MIPRKGLHLQPPKFHYGWAISGPQFEAVARKHGFLFVENEDLSDLSEDEDPYEYKPFISYGKSTDRLVPMLKNLGVKWSLSTVTLSTVYHRYQVAISLTTNYARDNLTPPAEELAIVQEFLEFDKAPGWFVDGPMGRWDWRHMSIARH